MASTTQMDLFMGSASFNLVLMLIIFAPVRANRILFSPAGPLGAVLIGAAPLSAFPDPLGQNLAPQQPEQQDYNGQDQKRGQRAHQPDQGVLEEIPRAPDRAGKGQAVRSPRDCSEACGLENSVSSRISMLTVE